MSDPSRDADHARSIESWFQTSARDLPWRTSPRDPWVSFVSEAMLQQTQVSRVVEKLGPFLERFPTPAALAEADEEAVLAAWQGLGYYRRARHLQSAARTIAAEHNGEVPADPRRLIELKGVGRYTAGAVASIVFGRREPIVDGNVARVLVRLEGRPLRAGDRETEAWAWRRARELVEAAGDPAALNEGLMELGAVVCTPRSPKCPRCPVSSRCRALASGAPEAYPLPKTAPARSELHHAVVVVRDMAGRLLVEKRPERGLWSGLWQPIGLERDGSPHDPGEIRRGLAAEGLEPAGRMVYETTHRRVMTAVWTATAASGSDEGIPRRWLPADELREAAMSNLHRRIALAALGPVLNFPAKNG